MRSQDITSLSLSLDRALFLDSTVFSIKMGSSSTFTMRHLILCSIAILLLAQRTAALPVDEALIRCSPGSDRRNTCEKCAKVTRDDSAYLLCCTREGDQQWCEDFLNFTLRP